MESGFLNIDVADEHKKIPQPRFRVFVGVISIGKQAKSFGRNYSDRADSITFNPSYQTVISLSYSSSRNFQPQIQLSGGC
jgi:hypothetical protein